MLLVLPNATFGRTGSRRRKTKALEQHGALLINLLYLELSLYKYLTSLTVAVSNYLSSKFETNVFKAERKQKIEVNYVFFPSADFEGENSATQSVVFCQKMAVKASLSSAVINSLEEAKRRKQNVETGGSWDVSIF